MTHKMLWIFLFPSLVSSVFTFTSHGTFWRCFVVEGPGVDEPRRGEKEAKTKLLDTAFENKWKREEDKPKKESVGGGEIVEPTVENKITQHQQTYKRIIIIKP